MLIPDSSQLAEKAQDKICSTLCVDLTVDSSEKPNINGIISCDATEKFDNIKEQDIQSDSANIDLADDSTNNKRDCNISLSSSSVRSMTLTDENIKKNTETPGLDMNESKDKEEVYEKKVRALNNRVKKAKNFTSNQPVIPAVCSTIFNDEEDNDDSDTKAQTLKKLIESKKLQGSKGSYRSKRRRIIVKADPLSAIPLSETQHCDVFVIGQGDAGQLGLGVDIFEQIRMRLLMTDHPASFIQVACGGMHTLALTAASHIYSWGCNDEGALGRISLDDSEYTPLLVTSRKGLKFSKVVCGDSFSAALAIHGTLFAWGTFRDSRGPIGLIKSGVIEPFPKVIYDDVRDPCVDVCCGSNHILLLTNNGRVLSCGCGDEGQLGRLSELFAANRGGRRGCTKLTLPEEVFVLGPSKRRYKNKPEGKIIAIGSGGCSSFACSGDGKLYGWGLNNYCQLGSVFKDRVFFPTFLKDISKICTIDGNGAELEFAGGPLHTLILNTKTGIIYSVGCHQDGRLGRSSLKDKGEKELLSDDIAVKPVDICNPPAFFKKIACGDACSFALSSDSKLYAWGMGCNHQLGIGNGDDVYSPTQVLESCIKGDKILDISSGAQHTALLVEKSSSTSS